MARRDVSEQRKAAYYLGGGLILIGFLVFGSVFVTGAMNFGDFTDFDNKARSGALRGVVGMGLMILGAAIRAVGARGLAGSGVVLDPQRARKDVEPWSRMGGGMLKDGLDEAGIDLGGSRKADDEDEPSFDEKLRRLHALHADGILSDEEYEREKREVLDSN